MGSSIWQKSTGKIRKWLGVSLCAAMAFQVFLLQPIIANAVGDVTPPTIDSLIVTAGAGKFAQEIGSTWYTNDSSATVTATYSDIGGSLINPTSAALRINGVALDASVVDDAHIVATLPGLAQADNYALSAVVKDGDNNQGNETETLVIDTAAPNAPIISAPLSTTSSNQTPVISGTIETNSTVEIYDGGSPLTSDLTTSDGTFSVASPSLAGGTHLLTAVATDQSGNVSTTSNTVTYDVDVTAPAVPTLTHIANTAEPRPAFNWTNSGDGSAFQYHLQISADGFATELVDVTQTTDFYFPSSDLPNGTISWRVAAIDFYGNPSAFASDSFVLDNAAPVISNLAPGDGSTTANGMVTISADLSDSGSGINTDSSSVVFNVNDWPIDSGFSITGSHFSYTPPSAYDDGTYPVSLTISDNAGHSTTATWSFTVSSAPTIDSVTATGVRVVTGYINNTNTGATITGTVLADAGGQTVELYVDSSLLTTTVVAPGATTYGVILSTDEFNSLKSVEGTKSLQVLRIGSDASHSALSAASTIVVDTVAPSAPDTEKVSVAQNAPGNNDTISGTAGAVSSDTTEVYVYQSDGSTEITHLAPNGDGSFGPVSIGDNANTTVKVAARDAAGNESAQISKDNDIVAPDAPAIISPADNTFSQNATVTVSGTAEANSTVTISGSGAPVTTTATTGGTFSVDITLATNGAYTFSATATDTAGNMSVVSNSRTYTFDNVAPTVVSTSPADGGLTNNNMTSVSVTWTDTTAGFSADPIRTLQIGSLGKTTGWDSVDTMTYTPGSSSADGSYTVTATIRDKAGNQGTVTFSYTIDTEAPVISAHDPVVAEATSAAGATVDYTASNAIDNHDATAPATCAPASGSLFPLGDTTVTCNKADAAGNVATPTTFTVTVQDTTKPVITLTGDNPATLEVHGTYTDAGATWTDAVDGTGAAVKTGAVDVGTVGTYTLHFNYTDAAGNVADEVTRTVNIVDTTKPVIATHGDETADPTSAAGATVTYTAPGVTDNYDAPSTATCLPASGSLFPIGPTMVTCTATDAHGNVADPVTFTVTVTDTTAPVIDDVTGTTGTTGEPTTITATAHDNVAPTHATISINSAPAVDMVGSASPFTYDVPVPSDSTASINYTVTVYDAAGLSTSSSKTITVSDNDVPSGTIALQAHTTTGVSDPTLYTRTTTLDITLSAVDNIGVATVSLKDDQSVGWTLAGAGLATTSYTLSGTTKGTRTVYVQYCDAAGNCYETNDTIIYETSAPSKITGVTDGTFTNNKELQFSWNATTDLPVGVNSGLQYYQVTVQLYNTGTSTWGNVAGLANINVGMATSYQLTSGQASGLVDGLYRVNAQAKDNAGNTLSTASNSDGVVLDTTPAVITVTLGSPVTVERTHAYTDAGATWTDAVDGSGTLVGSGTVNVNTVGSYSITYSYTDQAGNLTTATRTVNVVDTTAPVITQVTPVTTPTAAPVYVFNTDETGTIIYGGACAATTATTTAAASDNTIALTGLGSGTYSGCTVTVTDASSNISNTLTLPDFTVDVTAPGVTVNNVTTKDTTPDLSGTVDDHLATVSVNVNGVDYVAINDGAGSWSLSGASLPVLADGTYTVTVTATDVLGNHDSATGTLKIDNAAPTVSSPMPTNPVAGRRPEISVLLSDPIAGVNAASLVMRVNGVAVAASFNAGTGKFSFQPTRDLSPRSYTVAIDGKDLLGNTMTRFTYSFTIN